MEDAMNYGRLAFAAVAAWIADAVYGFVVYGNLLNSEFGKYPGVFRPMEAINAKMPIMFGGILVALFIVAFMYAKGYEGGAGAIEGARFGALVGVFMAAYVALGNYATLNIGLRLAGLMAIGGIVEWMVVGTVIGLVYKPAVSPSRRAAGVS
jgi:hypothetical protein